MEWWSGGVVEWWSGGVVEWWSIGTGPEFKLPNIPSLQYSIIVVFSIPICGHF